VRNDPDVDSEARCSELQQSKPEPVARKRRLFQWGRKRTSRWQIWRGCTTG